MRVELSNPVIPERSSGSYFRAGVLGVAHLAEKAVAVYNFAPACIYGAYNGLFNRIRQRVGGEAEPLPVARQFSAAYQSPGGLVAPLFQEVSAAALPTVAGPVLNHTLGWNATKQPFTYLHRAGLVGLGGSMALAQLEDIQQLGNRASQTPTTSQEFAHPVMAMTDIIQRCLLRAKTSGQPLNARQDKAIKEASQLVISLSEQPLENVMNWIAGHHKELEVFKILESLFPETKISESAKGPQKSSGAKNLLLGSLGLLGSSLAGNALYQGGKKLLGKSRAPAEELKEAGGLAGHFGSMANYGFITQAAGSFEQLGALGADVANVGYCKVFPGEVKEEEEILNPWYDPEAVKKVRDASWVTKGLDAAYLTTKLTSVGVQTALSYTSPAFIMGALFGLAGQMMQALNESEEGPGLETGGKQLKMALEKGSADEIEGALQQVEVGALKDVVKAFETSSSSLSPLQKERQRFHELPTKDKFKDLVFFAAKESGNALFASWLPTKFPSFRDYKFLPGAGLGAEMVANIGQWVPDGVEKAAHLVGIKSVNKSEVRLTTLTGLSLGLVGLLAYRMGGFSFFGGIAKGTEIIEANAVCPYLMEPFIDYLTTNRNYCPVG